METIKIKKNRDNAQVPQRATEGSAGMDLCACIDEPITLRKGEHAVIPTGISVELPNESYVTYVFARSGLAIKHGITLLNCVGVIDSDYRGEICVGLINQFDESYTITPGERIAQMVVSPVCIFPVTQVNELSDTARGEGGFGSTGR